LSGTYKLKFLLLSILLISALMISLNVGRYPVNMINLFEHLTKTAKSGNPNDISVDVLLRLRVPRVIMGVVAGMVSGATATALQATFRNPLVSPYMLGVTQGAAFGAALAIYFNMPPPLIPLLSLLFALLALGVTLILAAARQAFSQTLILAGIIVGAIFSALLSILQYIIDPFRLQNVVFWLMGGLYRVTWENLTIALLGAVLGLALLLAMQWRLNLLSLSDEEAKTLGCRVNLERLLVFSAAALAEASVVSVTGIIAFIGLMIPHLCRPFFGSDNRVLLPASTLTGAITLVLTDTLCRSLYSFEIPISIVTTLITAPYFIYILEKISREWR